MSDPEQTRRFRFSLRQLLLAVAVVAIGLAIWNWVFRKEVVVNAPRAEDKIFGDESLKSRRNVAVLTGSFMNGSYTIARLYFVKSGVITYNLTHAAAKKKGGTFRETATFRLALGESRVSSDMVTEFLFVGENPPKSISWTSSPFTSLPSITPTLPTINVVAKTTLPGTITPGRPHIVYVEGDRKIVVDSSMSVEEFATANPGNYLVVTVEVK